jgi:TPR repeat protein
MIGYMYSYGDGINQDKQKAKEYFKQAANKGMKEAIEELNKLDKEV